MAFKSLGCVAARAPGRAWRACGIAQRRLAAAAAHAHFSTTTLAWNVPAHSPTKGVPAAGRWRRSLVNELATEELYSRRVDLAEAAHIVSEPGYLWSAAVADAAAAGVDAQQYVAGVVNAAETWMHKREIHNRDVVRRQLELVLRDEGELALVLGGKSVGKSFILKKLAQELQTGPTPRRVVIVDGRLHGSDLARGFIKAVAEQQPESFLQRLRSSLVDRLQMGLVHVDRPKQQIDFPDMLFGFVKVCEQEGTFPCLIIDECNAVLQGTSPEQRTLATSALAVMTKFTKQDLRMNVVLASADHDEPFRLTALNSRQDHLTAVIVVGEVPPASMRDLLMTQWGMGPNLADACMSVWGGHVWGVYNGLSELHLETSTYAAIDNIVSFSFDTVHGARACVAAEDSDPAITNAANHQHRHMRALLREVAERGYAPLTAINDPRVKLGGQLNVLAMVLQAVMAAHIPHEAFDQDTCALAVAASESTRMLLAWQLRTFERRQGDAAGAAQAGQSSVRAASGAVAAASTRHPAGATATSKRAGATTNKPAGAPNVKME